MTLCSSIHPIRVHHACLGPLVSFCPFQLSSNRSSLFIAFRTLFIYSPEIQSNLILLVLNRYSISPVQVNFSRSYPFMPSGSYVLFDNIRLFHVLSSVDLVQFAISLQIHYFHLYCRAPLVLFIFNRRVQFHY